VWIYGGYDDASLARRRGSGELIMLAVLAEPLAHHELIPLGVDGGPLVRAVVVTVIDVVPPGSDGTTSNEANP
jgi:hypothetical protein